VLDPSISNKAKSLAIANRSRVSSAQHNLTTVNVQGEEAYVTAAVAAAVGSINFILGYFFTGEERIMTAFVTAARWRKIS